MKSLVIGLGNTGLKYKSHRHNVGSEIILKICEKKNIDLVEYSKFQSRIAVDTNNVHYLIPNSFMNLSGYPVASFLKNKTISNSNIFVIHDDLDLKLGVIRLKKGGGTGGHNGIKSLANSLVSKEFNRIRIGIGRPVNSGDIVKYVLSSPPPDEKEVLHRSMDQVAGLIDDITNQRLELSMNLLNRKNQS